MVTLIDVEAALTLFAEGIAGRYYHIKPASEFGGRQFDLQDEQTAMAVDTVYVPDELDYPDSAAYRVLVMLQLGQKEFGTYRFQMDVALTRIPALTGLSTPQSRMRASDFALFFAHVPHPSLLKRLFLAAEQVRITARLLERYPGLAEWLSGSFQR